MERTGFRIYDRMRIKSSQEFSRTFRRGVVVADGTLVMHAVKEISLPTRLGISIPKKTGNAPVRNHWKRLIRESYRLDYDSLPAHTQIIVRPRKGASADFPSVRRSLGSLAKRAAKKLAREAN